MQKNAKFLLLFFSRFFFKDFCLLGFSEVFLQVFFYIFYVFLNNWAKKVALFLINGLKNRFFGCKWGKNENEWIASVASQNFTHPGCFFTHPVSQILPKPLLSSTDPFKKLIQCIPYSILSWERYIDRSFNIQNYVNPCARYIQFLKTKKWNMVWIIPQIFSLNCNIIYLVREYCLSVIDCDPNWHTL